MSLISSIETIITTFYPDSEYILSSTFHANKQSFDITSAKMHMIILDNELSKDAEIKPSANVHKDTRIVISFLDEDSLDNTDAQTEVIRAAMESMADTVAFQIYQLPDIRPSGNQKYKLTPAFHVFNTNLSGVIMEIKAIENVVISCT